jgi:molybdopterin-binding protein
MLEEDVPHGGLHAAGTGEACGRATMTLSCIEEAERMMRLAGGAAITVSITNAAADELGLTTGETAYAVMKAADVMIGKD